MKHNTYAKFGNQQSLRIWNQFRKRTCVFTAFKGESSGVEIKAKHVLVL